MQSYHWGLWDQNVGLEMIREEWSILSFSAKWLHEKKVIFKHVGGHGVDNVRNDFILLNELWKLLDEADIVITQNGVAFDIKKINSRMLYFQIPPYSPIRNIDTLLVAKKHFAFTSNKLAWMSKHHTKQKKSEHKKFPGFELWAECLKDNPKAWAEMKHYNSLDVRATEELYLKMRPWISGHPDISVYNDVDLRLCPKCGSSALLQNRGTVATQTGVFQRVCCNSCGGWSRSRVNILDKSKRALLLTS